MVYKNQKNLEIKIIKNMNNKTEHLDFYVSQTLDNLEKWEYPSLNIPKNDRNVFVGSGSAACVAQLFAKKYGGFYLNASDYRDFVDRSIDKKLFSVYIISASGGKDSVPMADFFLEQGLKPNLITCNSQAPVKNKVANLWAFPSFCEPPTYNTSTYGAMIYWLFKEDIQAIKKHIQTLKIPDLRKYHYIFFMAEDKYSPIAEMASRKVAETLQGIGVNSAGFTHGAHGMLRQPDKKRLVFTMNLDYPFQENIYKLNIDSYLGLMLATYYIIGKNQKDSDTKNLLADYQKVVQKLGWKLNKIN